MQPKKRSTKTSAFVVKNFLFIYIVRESMIRIESPYFVAGVIVQGDKVIRAAPIVKYMFGWTATKVVEYCKKKGWKYERYE
jgi:hypothetical protein